MIKENIERLKERINSSCQRSGRDARKIGIVFVTKGQPVERIMELVSLGCKDLGENKVQEAFSKYSLIPKVSWHMIGHLQRNKAKEAVKIFDLIHSVDSVDLAKEINKHSFKNNKFQDILIEVKTSPEKTKWGIDPAEVEEISSEIDKLKNVVVKGLMTIAPLSEKAEQAREYFSLIRNLRDQINPRWLLSMGMSDDFEIAIEEGADIIRIGRAVFNG